MDGAVVSAASSGPSEAGASTSHEEDARHYATTASQVAKPASTSNPPSILPLDLNVKNTATRVHEDCHEIDMSGPRLRSSRVWKGKGKEVLSIEKEAKKPLGLLDLPVDVLKDIVREVTHTNDLTSLALCHSALHRLTTPQIYSRFDIVWPDSSTHSEPRSGVDALTYGLATLVMAEEVFGEAPVQREAHSNRFVKSGYGTASDMAVRRRRGNHYAHFTRKFSLGNGPADWVQEYLISKEGGKMLGTLVALAVARMQALETFVWDMPTGILRDVWAALSSLGDCESGESCRLEKVWVRFHNNSPDNLAPPPPNAVTLPSLHPNMAHSSILRPVSQIKPADLDRVEHPSFSGLPPLRSLSVLDIDELAYLDEMAVLIGRSLDKLRELRVGIARHAITRSWATVWEGDNLPQVDTENPTAGFLTIGEKRQGGVLGTLVGFVHDMRPKVELTLRRKKRTMVRPVVQVAAPAATEESLYNATPGVDDVEEAADQADDTPPPLFASGLSPLGTDPALENDPLVASSRSPSPNPLPALASPSVILVDDPDPPSEPELLPEILPPSQLHHRLQLDKLELERVALSIPVLRAAIDWSRLTSLTLLHCQNHEALWKSLRRIFCPTPKSPTYPTPRRASNSTPRKGHKNSISPPVVELQYNIHLKRVHTNTVSSSLISFLKETLAPNSLEVLFLQEGRSYSSAVAIDAIYRGPIRRHRQSLRKILIDSSEKNADGLPTSSSKWRRWMLTRDILAFICSGKMPALRELGMAVDYHDWHFFLQRLPSIPHLRSLYIPFLADHVHGTNVDPRELASQIVDIVALRPEVELCYMGIANKCFEILESRKEFECRNESRLGLGPGADEHPASGGEDADEDDDADGDGEDEDEDEDQEGEGEETESDDDEEDVADDDTDSDDGSENSSEKAAGPARLRLREILFYDDKVAVFKARHGRL